MAQFQSYDPIDMRNIEFTSRFFSAQNVYDAATITLAGRTYKTGLEYVTTSTQGDSHALGLYGTGLESNARTALPSAGTVTAIFGWFYSDSTWYYNIWVRDISVPAKTLAAVMKTPSLADDQALVNRMFSGADRIDLSEYDDRFGGKGGKDTIFGDGGDDTLYGDDGNDRLLAGQGNDNVYGGSGNDTLIGGNDVYSDDFIFTRTDGNDRIIGFEDGIDRIVLLGATGFRQVTILDRGADTLVRFGNTQITLEQFDHKNLTADDFLFAG